MQPFDLLNHAAKAEMPERLTDIGSWHRHIPFAFALLDMLKPRVFVELGTHKGDSYSAFCQGVTHQGLATRCFAVDTWQGDSQAGRYEDSIHAELSRYHDPRYASFSTLLRMTFDEALAHIADGSVDLLHIDGLHTYEAVKHDFDTWLPKMSERGVIIFHDTNVHYGDFAVWQLWEELTRQYPGFEFPYGFGLGVLAVGSNVPEPLQQFLQLASDNPQRVIQLFHALGDGIELFKSERSFAQKQEQLERLGCDLSEAREVVEQRDTLLVAYNQQRDELIAQNADLRARLDMVGRSKVRLAELNETYLRAVADRNQLDLRLRQIGSSRLWRARNALMRMLGQPQRVVTGDLEVFTDEAGWAPPSVLPRVDIIIPVYRGLEETKACIESVLALHSSALSEIIVIEDCSPEPELAAWLQTLDGRVTLLRNEHNLGFVKTVNRGMALHPERDVLLLNSDTEVAGDWLECIQRVAYEQARTGSVTPFSNSATICSYPQFCKDNELPRGLDVQAMDKLFRSANAGQSVDIPTAVGFCMFIRRDCLNDCGLFDEELFGRGYGEENEFCMRSARRGWLHKLTGDVFVYHKGGVSFAETQSENQKAGHRALTRVFPDYDLVVRDHIMADPAARMRFAVDLLRARSGELPVVLMVNHSRGGGTERHLLELAETLKGQAELYLLQPNVEGGSIALGPLNGGERARLLFEPERDSLLLQETLQALGVSRIHFHHTIGVHLQFLLLPQQLEVPYDVTIHDYYLVCPQVTMTSAEGRYCGAPDESGCNACLATRPAPGGVSIDRWRAFGEKLLYGAERVFIPSLDTRKRMQRYFPEANFVFAPHEIDSAQPVRIVPLEAQRPLKVLVLGALSRFKGADLLEACVLAARKTRSPLEFHLLGYAYRTLACHPFSNLRVHGAYDDARVEQLVKELSPDLVWFPGSCPETYSYTLSICLRMGLPVVAPDIGAFSERLASRPWSWLLPADIEPAQAHTRLLEVREQLLASTFTGTTAVVAEQVEPFRYEGGYLSAESPVRGSEPDWQHLHAGWAQLGASQRILPAVRFPRLLRLLQRSLALPGVSALLGRTPAGLKQVIKRVLWR